MVYQHQEHGSKTWPLSKLWRKEKNQRFHEEWICLTSGQTLAEGSLDVNFLENSEITKHHEEIKSWLAKGRMSIEAKSWWWNSHSQGQWHTETSPSGGTLISGHIFGVNGSAPSFQSRVRTLPGSAISPSPHTHTATVPWRDTKGAQAASRAEPHSHPGKKDRGKCSP